MRYSGLSHRESAARRSASARYSGATLAATVSKPCAGLSASLATARNSPSFEPK